MRRTLFRIEERASIVGSYAIDRPLRSFIA